MKQFYFNKNKQIVPCVECTFLHLLKVGIDRCVGKYVVLISISYLLLGSEFFVQN